MIYILLIVAIVLIGAIIRFIKAADDISRTRLEIRRIVDFDIGSQVSDKVITIIEKHLEEYTENKIKGIIDQGLKNAIENKYYQHINDLDDYDFYKERLVIDLVKMINERQVISGQKLNEPSK